MRFTLKSICTDRACGGAAFIALVAAAMLSAPASAADGVFIQQAGQPGHSAQPVSFSAPAIKPPSSTPRSGITQPTPETAAAATGRNFAGTLETGQFNQVFQAQAGGSSLSNVGILGGQHDNVNVLQGGKDLSNVVLVNTKGLTVDVVQPTGTAPINALVLRLPNGALDVIQPKGAPPVNIARLPNGGIVLFRR